jgi:hypothetical protein
MALKPNINVTDYGQPALVLGLIAVAVTIARWRDWFWSDSLKLADGSPDPRAGKFIVEKAVADFLFVPTLVVVGCVILGLGYQMAFAVAAVVFLAFVGSAWISSGLTTARDKAIDAFIDRIRGRGK